MSAEAQTDRLEAMQARIDALRARRRSERNPARSPAAEKFTAASLAWRMVTELVTGVLMGAGIGWGLDAMLGTVPVFLIVFALLGFAAGIRTMMRSAAEVEQKQKARGDAAPDNQTAAQAGRMNERG
ncbi:MAG: AtpZ/AtpI family protein [Rubrimonas sp.]